MSSWPVPKVMRVGYQRANAIGPDGLGVRLSVSYVKNIGVWDAHIYYSYSGAHRRLR